MEYRIGGIAITPPKYGASGGVSAGIQLMREVAELVDTRMMVMGAADNENVDGVMHVDTVAAFNLAGPFRTHLPSRIITMLWRARFGDWIDRVRPSVVHLHNPHPPGALAMAAHDCDLRGIPYVLSTHGFVEYDDFSRAYATSAWQRPFVERIVRQPLVKVARGAARIFMLSPAEDAIFKRMGVSADRLEVVTNGIDPSFVKLFDAAKVERLTARFSLEKDKTVIFFVGNHTRNKGIDILLEARKSIAGNVQLVIGGGKRSEEEHREMLRKAAVDPDADDVVFTGFLDADELRALYQRCDVFAFPSRADTLPLVVLEAMASAKPVVSTTVGGIPYQVTKDTGFLVEPGDSVALSRSLNTLVADRDLRLRMGAAGRERAIEHFDWKRSAEKAIRLYEEVLAEVRS